MSENKAILVVGLGFGDEGKGSVVDYLVRESGAHTVIRYNGGAQAAHNVVDPSGKHHTFAQFGSGTLVPGTRTHLSRFMMIEPLSLMKEEAHLRELGVFDALQRMTIDRQALVTTPYHQAANRLREMARGKARHGSCGRGIGETMSDYLTYTDRVLFAGDLCERPTLLRKLRFLREEKLAGLGDVIASLPDTEFVRKELCVLTNPDFDEFCAGLYSTLANQVRIVDESYLRERLRMEGTVVFEGAQGALLDENYGFHPYTTWSTTTLRNALQLLGEQGYKGQIVKLGVLRSYSTRHGPGPFVTEDDQMGSLLPDQHNGTNIWQRDFRIGPMDLVMVRYALDIVGGVDYLALTNMDRLSQLPEWHLCPAYVCDGSGSSKPAEYCDLNNGQVTRIKNRLTVDLLHQERLANFLLQCRPQYQVVGSRGKGVEVNVGEYLSLLQSHFHVPVAFTSHGPTAKEKRTWLDGAKLGHAGSSLTVRYPALRSAGTRAKLGASLFKSEATGLARRLAVHDASSGH